MLHKNVVKLLRNQFWLYITWKNEQKISLWHFGICPGQCTTDRREYALIVWVQLKERDLKKSLLTKVMEIFDNYYAKISFRGIDISVFCCFRAYLSVSSFTSCFFFHSVIWWNFSVGPHFIWRVFHWDSKIYFKT